MRQILQSKASFIIDICLNICLVNLADHTNSMTGITFVLFRLIYLTFVLFIYITIYKYGKLFGT